MALWDVFAVFLSVTYQLNLCVFNTEMLEMMGVKPSLAQGLESGETSKRNQLGVTTR